mmetsp:Transcript_28520/g.29672  ORF Transcript_28520/g.29672 Transcript_28520/m.29672 type:complete len:118 (-) Transcript_28520:43-396(-)
MVEEETIFHKMVKGYIPVDKIYEDEDVLAFKDINPQAPFHCLVIPRKMQGLSSLAKATDEHKDILGKLMLAVAKIAEKNKLEKGFRTVINTGQEGGQTVNYIHIHILAGRELKWPPG